MTTSAPEWVATTAGDVAVGMVIRRHDREAFEVLSVDGITNLEAAPGAYRVIFGVRFLGEGSVGLTGTLSMTPSRAVEVLV